MGVSAGPVATVRRALLSVSDPTGLVDLARVLAQRGIEVVATRGTRTALRSAGLVVRPAEDLTGIGDWFSGRLKTLHPGLLGGILAPRTPEGVAELERRGLLPIDLVVSNLYPFERHLAESPGARDLEEFIDVGGVTLTRAAAKNHTFVAIASDPSDYAELAVEIAAFGGTSEALRRTLARRAFERTAAYDRAIAAALAPPGPGGFPPGLAFEREPITLRYGENPHQGAAVYRLRGPGAPSMAALSPRLRKGEALSYTNLLDLDTARAIVAEFPTPTAAVVKHATPCGVASGATIAEAIAAAIATDPVARYGGVVAVNRPLGEEDPEAIKGVFVDLLAAPSFAPEALERLGKRPKLKAVELSADPGPAWEAKSALGHLLLQEADRRQLAPGDFRPVTGGRATPKETCSLDFAWRVVRHARSNAIVLADGSTTVGIGSGQPTRVKAVELALEVAGPRAKGAVLASDAFFPFADGIEAAGRAGIRAILQPGGSLRDEEVIAAAERYGIAMYLTGWRVFRH